MEIHYGSSRKLIHMICTIFSIEHQIRINYFSLDQVCGLEKYFTKIVMFKLTFEGFHQLEINKDIQKEETAQVKDIAEWNIVASGSRR